MQVIFFILLFFIFTNSNSFANTQCKTEICKQVYTGDIQRVEAILKKNKKQINVKENHGNSLLHIAVLNQDLSMIKILLKYGANINAQDKGGATALHIAARGNLNTVVEALLEANADINIQDNEGFSAIMRAVLLGKSEAVITILASKAPSCKIKNNYGQNLPSINPIKLSDEAKKILKAYVKECQNN
ncbi:ankyrin repeat domain-containing protein [Candidatus Deianiraea vastatrix]|uniref:Ankyrin repeats (3 copies) n=1 Tax=Candidatus Deianiraea vastatrix TaxID=2163644 RepID=A0A5B8XGC8_9RICK|nr:ankyrin repeat domain-containing protein [Candidatus Deianiraea vastatrix]QED23929.1 Ankyrin repeats (3 copies) [Candidatus Deianiraea vastatrix]